MNHVKTRQEVKNLKQTVTMKDAETQKINN